MKPVATDTSNFPFLFQLWQTFLKVSQLFIPPPLHPPSMAFRNQLANASLTPSFSLHTSSWTLHLHTSHFQHVSLISMLLVCVILCNKPARLSVLENTRPTSFRRSSSSLSSCFFFLSCNQEHHCCIVFLQSGWVTLSHNQPPVVHLLTKYCVHPSWPWPTSVATFSEYHRVFVCPSHDNILAQQSSLHFRGRYLFSFTLICHFSGSPRTLHAPFCCLFNPVLLQDFLLLFPAPRFPQRIH